MVDARKNRARANGDAKDRAHMLNTRENRARVLNTRRNRAHVLNTRKNRLIISSRDIFTPRLSKNKLAWSMHAKNKD